MNLTLKEAGIIQGSTGALTDFTVSGIQVDIDVMISSWNQVIREMFRTGVLPNETSEGTLTLITDTSSYSFSGMSITDFERLVANPKDITNEQTIVPYPYKTLDGKTGWLAMYELLRDRSDNTSIPRYWAINTSNGNLEVDTQPSSEFAGRTYTFLYEKRINLSGTTDTFPFSDSVVDELVLPVVEIFRAKRKDKFNQRLFLAGMAGAVHLGINTIPASRYGVR